jgi:hypothetical protein
MTGHPGRTGLDGSELDDTDRTELGGNEVGGNEVGGNEVGGNEVGGRECGPERGPSSGGGGRSFRMVSNRDRSLCRKALSSRE